MSFFFASESQLDEALEARERGAVPTEPKSLPSSSVPATTPNTTTSAPTPRSRRRHLPERLIMPSVGTTTTNTTHATPTDNSARRSYHHHHQDSSIYHQNTYHQNAHTLHQNNPLSRGDRSASLRSEHTRPTTHSLSSPTPTLTQDPSPEISTLGTATGINTGTNTGLRTNSGNAHAGIVSSVSASAKTRTPPQIVYTSTDTLKDEPRNDKREEPRNGPDNKPGDLGSRKSKDELPKGQTKDSAKKSQEELYKKDQEIDNSLHPAQNREQGRSQARDQIPVQGNQSQAQSEGNSDIEILTDLDTDGTPVTLSPVTLDFSRPSSRGFHSPSLSLTASYADIHHSHLLPRFHHSRVPSSTLSQSLYTDNASDSNDGGPQFIMPSVTLPKPRPFTAEGKSLGRMRIIVAGQPGLGRTSLIHAIISACEHIVHADDAKPLLTDSVASLPNWTPESITEITASTQPYPAWWSPDGDPIAAADELPVLSSTLSESKRLDRNISFLDIPCPNTSWVESNALVDMVEKHVYNTAISSRLPEIELLDFLSGDGSPLFGAVLYLIPHEGSSHSDIANMKHIQQYTNVIPVLARIDTLPPDEIDRVKHTISTQLKEAGIVSSCPIKATHDSTLQAPSLFAVSTKPAALEDEEMDSSVLMKSDYLPPQTELGQLVEAIFCTEGMSWLRYTAAKKYIRARRSHNESQSLQLSSLASRVQPPPQQTRPETALALTTAPQRVGRTATSNHAPQLPYQWTSAVPFPSSTTFLPDMFPPSAWQASSADDGWARSLARSISNDRHRAEESLSEQLEHIDMALTSYSPPGPLEPYRRRRHLVAGNDDLNGNGNRNSNENRNRSGKDKRRRRKRTELSLDADPLGILSSLYSLRETTRSLLRWLSILGALGGLSFWAYTSYRWYRQHQALAQLVGGRESYYLLRDAYYLF